MLFTSDTTTPPAALLATTPELEDARTLLQQLVARENRRLSQLTALCLVLLLLVALALGMTLHAVGLF